MKVLIAISLLLAVVSAGHLGVHAPLAYAHHAPLAYAAHYYGGAQHLPVIGPNGVPLEPAENVARRAFHANAHVEAAARNGDLYAHHVVAAPVAHAVAHHAVAHHATHPIAYAGHYAHQHLPVIGPNGVPLEPAENVARRAFHANAHVEATARNGDLYAHSWRKRRSVVAAPLAVAHHAYAAHYYGGPQHLPVIGPNGVPLEPAENVERRAFHANAHVEAAARNGDLYAHHVVAAPVAHAVAHHAVAHHAVAHHGVAVHPAHTFPALAHDGQPLETPEVVAAKSAHFAAHIDANARNHGAHVYAAHAHPIAYAAHAHPLAYAHPVAHAVAHHGVPLDTPEVVAAKAAHFAAHAHAKAVHHGIY